VLWPIEAFSSEAESGSHEENASKQKPGVFHRFHETVKDSPGRKNRAAALQSEICS
jgi:hypothetical protein